MGEDNSLFRLIWCGKNNYDCILCLLLDLNFKNIADTKTNIRPRLCGPYPMTTCSVQNIPPSPKRARP